MYLYAAYNAAPKDLAGGPDEQEWYSLLRAEPLIRGLELSFNAAVHPSGPEALAALLDPRWENVVTTIPGTIAGVARDSGYGLASASEPGRAAALDHVRALRRDVAALVSAGRPVIAVELHSAPTGGSVERLTESLTEIASWDWGSTAVLVEHADALVPEHPPVKGWMRLEGEIAAVSAASAATGRRLGHTVNWGRSAIESASASGALDHIRALGASLRGLMISGASPLATARSTPWEDSHLALDTFEPESLLTADAVRAALDAVGELDYLGVKVGRAADATTLAGRLAPGLGTLHALDELVRARA
ncbi:MAG: hypothetical protein JWR04_2414 [Rhodoglobus sp.]|nr:hypothetical protein [Rhodoglobus sp.]